MEKIKQLEFDDLEQIMSLRMQIQNYDFAYENLDSIILNEKELKKIH